MKTTSIAFALASTAILFACGGEVKRPDGGTGMLPVGASAPDLLARNPAEQEIRLSDLRGKPVVVYFYPSDGTPGCTTEACAFRDAWQKFEQANVAIIGVSDNSVQRHVQFQKDHNIPFPLASDFIGTIGQAYGVKHSFVGYERVSFLVDKEGKIAHVWPNVDPGVHADEVLAKATEGSTPSTTTTQPTPDAPPPTTAPSPAPAN